MNTKLLLILFFLLACFASNSSLAQDSYDLSEIRVSCKSAFENEKLCERFKEELSAIENPNNLEKAYLGAMGIAQSLHAPFLVKYYYFWTGKNLLEESIEEDPNNIETRFLRFTIQSNIPSFLYYYSSLKDDKAFIIENIESTNDLFRERMLTFIKESQDFTANEKATLGL